MEKIAIIGAGLAGSLASVYLAKRGFEVHIFERRPDMRKGSIDVGKSINLAISKRGIEAIKSVDNNNVILQHALPMKGRQMHNREGELSFQPYGKEGQAINSISRGQLNVDLMNIADKHENVHFHFNQKFIDFDPKKGTCQIEENGNIKNFDADQIIGADGAFSKVRLRMMQKSRFDYSQSYLKHGFKELEIPALPNGGFRLDNDVLHIWPRESYMMIALPNEDGSFTVTIFLPFEGKNSFENLNTDKEILDFFNTNFKDAMPHLPNLLEDFKKNPTGSLVTVKSNPFAKGKSLLMGDAAHAVVPFYGQGMNAAFECVLALDKCLEAHYPNWDKVHNQYNEMRVANSHAIADLAIRNFTTMADDVADENFLKRKKIEHKLTQLYPSDFKSEYELVSFSTVPYTIAKQTGINNKKMLQHIISNKLEHKIEDKEFMLGLFKEFLG